MIKANIMIVEDEAIIAKDIENRLRDMAYATSMASSGEQAVEKALQDRPDLILMDIQLKGRIDGIEAAEIIQGRVRYSSHFFNGLL
jgi:CheY-like chemotaxis protein